MRGVLPVAFLQRGAGRWALPRGELSEQAGSEGSGRAEELLAKLPGLAKHRHGSSFIFCRHFLTVTFSSCFIFEKSPHFCDPLLN